MIIHWGTNEKTVRVLLDTGCTVPLISKGLVESLKLPMI